MLAFQTNKYQQMLDNAAALMGRNCARFEVDDKTAVLYLLSREVDQLRQLRQQPSLVQEQPSQRAPPETNLLGLAGCDDPIVLDFVFALHEELGSKLLAAANKLPVVRQIELLAACQQVLGFSDNQVFGLFSE